MSTLLFELGTEEIPAGYLAEALTAWKASIGDALSEARLTADDIRIDGTPRRIALFVAGLPKSQPDAEEKIVGPSKKAAYDDAGKPTMALQKFAESKGVDLRDCRVEDVPKKGERVVVTQRIPGQPLAAVLPGILRDLVHSTPFPKTMWWNRALDPAGEQKLRFARPIRRLCAVLDNKLLPVEIAGIESTNTVAGHPFLAPNDITILAADWDIYLKLLEKNFVVLPTEERQNRIRKGVNDALDHLNARAAAADLERLIPEVANLVEWPGTVVGRFKKEYLRLPAEVIRAAMIGHQRYVPVLDADADNLKNAFITIANRAEDADKRIAKGNERVLSARLHDAQFFWDEDCTVGLETLGAKGLPGYVFHQDLGNYVQKTTRLVALGKRLAGDHAGILPAEQVPHVERAAGLCKCDLVSQMVFEFTELQGVMGGYYAREAGEDAAVSAAIGEHYRPVGRDDGLPETSLGAFLSLVDRADSLAGYFLIGADRKSGDPLGLRRLSLGVIRILTARVWDLSLDALFDAALAGYAQVRQRDRKKKEAVDVEVTDEMRADAKARLRAYVADRLTQWAKDVGYAHDHIAAVQAAAPPTLAAFQARLDAVKELAGTDEWRSLCALVERTGNITKDMAELTELPSVDPKTFEAPIEREVFEAFEKVAPAVRKHLAAGHFAQACQEYHVALADRIHTFFDAKDGVIVNADDPAVRQNRRALLRHIYTLLADDFARLEHIVFAGDSADAADKKSSANGTQPMP